METIMARPTKSYCQRPLLPPLCGGPPSLPLPRGKFDNTVFCVLSTKAVKTGAYPIASHARPFGAVGYAPALVYLGSSLASSTLDPRGRSGILYIPIYLTVVVVRLLVRPLTVVEEAPFTVHVSPLHIQHRRALGSWYTTHDRVIGHAEGESASV
eukprot:scaffold38269_cov237-Amphora_coffeaeformis.AAC.1